MPELLVSCDKQIESALSGSEQGTVFQVRPAQLKGRLYNMVDQVISERYRSSLIEENVHFGWGACAQVRLQRGSARCAREQKRLGSKLLRETTPEIDQ